MSLNMNNFNQGGGQDLGTARPGAHHAGLLAIVDLGVQDGGMYKGQPKLPCQQLLLIFELFDDQVVIDNQSKNRIYSLKVNASRADNAKLTKVVGALDPTHSCGGDLSKLIGHNVILNLQQKAITDGPNPGKQVSIFESAMALMQGMQPLSLTQKPFIFDHEQPSIEVYANDLHNWMRERVKAGYWYRDSQFSQVVTQWESQQQSQQLPQAGFQAPQPQPQPQTQGVGIPQTGVPQMSVQQPSQGVPGLPFPNMPPLAGAVQTSGVPAATASTIAPPSTPVAAPVSMPPAPPGYRYDPATNSFVTL